MAQKWYPVIDYMACAECGVCMNFCPHHVYNKDRAPVPVVEYPSYTLFSFRRSLNCRICGRNRRKKYQKSVLILSDICSGDSNYLCYVGDRCYLYG